MSQKIPPFLEEKIEDKDEKFLFFSKITHELRTPIHGISGLSGYLNENWDNLDEAIKRKCIIDIFKASNILNDLIESFLYFSKVNSSKVAFVFKESDLILAIKTVIDQTITYHMPDSIKVIFDTKLTEAIAEVDLFWFKQLITNLLVNALNYSDKETVIINVGVNESDYVISIKDQGTGILESELKNIFKPFNQGSKNAGKIGSVGLGLSICLEIVNAHGGKIWAKNNLDVGVTVAVTIPIKRNLKI